MTRRCLGCGARIASGSRCQRCTAAKERERSRTREQPHYGGTWRKLSRDVRKAHVERYGLTCPGYGVPRHRVEAFRDLTLDHVNPRELDAGVRVLCRSCNARKGNRK